MNETAEDLRNEPVERVEMRDLARYETPRRITYILADRAGVTIVWDDGRESLFHSLWLRDNCACEQCRHPQTMERKFLFTDAPEYVAVGEARRTPGGDLEVRFAAAPGAAEHLSLFDAAWLRHHSYADWTRTARSRSPRLWEGSDVAALPVVDYRAVVGTDDGLRAWLEAMRDWGLVLLRGAPPMENEILRIAERVAPARPTNFGTVYDVVSQPNPNNSAFTSMALEPHTDLANWQWPPDFQLLFCIENGALGGGSILVDGFRVAEELRSVDPEAFEILSTQPIDFRFHDESCDIRHRAPTIEVGSDGGMSAIRFNNWLRSALDLPESMVMPTYAALRRFWKLLREPRFQMRLRLGAGDMIAFDNARVLHGREAFDPNTGRRHLQGCYLDRDHVLSRLRLLER